MPEGKKIVERREASLASYVLRRKCRAETQGQDRCASLPAATGGGVCGAATLAARQGFAVLQNIITERACTGFRNRQHRCRRHETTDAHGIYSDLTNEAAPASNRPIETYNVHVTSLFFSVYINVSTINILFFELFLSWK